MKSTPSTKGTWKTLTQGVKAKSLLIVIGAVLSCSAPFIHMLMQNESKEMTTLEIQLNDGEISKEYYDQTYPILKEKQKFFGFSSPRRFWYAMGTPITMLFFALLILTTAHLIGEQTVRKAIYFSSLILLFISTYHIVWVFWPRNDFPKNLYHLSIALMSISTTVVAILLLKYRLGLQSRIEKLIHFISIDAYFKYIKQEDKPEYMKDSYEVYDEIIK